MFFLFSLQTEFTSTLNAFIYWFSNIIGLLFFVLYLHQFVFLFVGLFKTSKIKKKDFNLHKLGIVISARNEELVIAHLIDSIRKNDYPQELIDIFVVADNCTDNTAQLCRDLGCIVLSAMTSQKLEKAMPFTFCLTNFTQCQNMRKNAMPTSCWTLTIS